MALLAVESHAMLGGAQQRTEQFQWQLATALLHIYVRRPHSQAAAGARGQ